MSGLRAIMVDLDGTLARTSYANWAAYKLALSESGVTIKRSQFESMAHARNWRVFLPEILLSAGIDVDAAVISRRKAEIYLALLETVEINWALVRMLEACRPKMRTAVVTTASAVNVEAFLRIHGLRSLFDTVVTGDDVRSHKPDPEAYVLAAKRLGVEPSDCLVYEDSNEGVKSASAFGAHVLRVIF